MTKHLSIADKKAIGLAGEALTPKQKAFVDNLFLPGLTQVEAAIKAGYAPRSADVAASRTIRLPHVVDYLDECVNRGVRGMAAGALGVVQDLSTTAKSPYVRLQAAQDILDRAGHKPIEKSMVGLVGELNVKIDLT